MGGGDWGYRAVRKVFTAQVQGLGFQPQSPCKVISTCLESQDLEHGDRWIVGVCWAAQTEW